MWGCLFFWTGVDSVRRQSFRGLEARGKVK